MKCDVLRICIWKKFSVSNKHVCDGQQTAKQHEGFYMCARVLAICLLTIIIQDQIAEARSLHEELTTLLSMLKFN